MKIGFDAKRIFHNTSGLGNYGRDIVATLSRYYPENDYLLYNPKPGKVNRLVPEGNMQLHYPTGYLNKKYSSAWRRGPIIKQLKKDEVQLFHGLSNELPTGIDKSGIPSVVTIHDLIFLRYPQWYSLPDRLIHKIKVKQAALSANHIIAISEQTKNDIIHFLNIPAEKIKVIYQGCSPVFKQAFSAESIEEIAGKFTLPERFLLNVGTIEPRKNLLTIVKSLHYHPLPLVVVGKETGYAKKVRQYIDEKQLQERVIFLSNVSMEELAVIYRLATVFCYPSIFEGFGIPIIESLYSKTPVITSKQGCFPEAGGPDSIYIDSQDEKMIGENIHLLLNDPVLYEQIVNKGLTFVQRFNDQTIASQVMALYEKVVQQ